MTSDTRSHLLLSAVLATAGICALTLCMQQLRDSRSAADQASSAHAAAIIHARAINHLQQQQTVVSDRPRAESDLVARLEHHLSLRGMRKGALRQVSFDQPRLISGTPYSRQQAAVTIDGLTPENLTHVLLDWKRDEPLWIVSAIRLNRDAPARRNQQPEQPINTYQVTLSLENIYLSQLSTGSTAPGDEGS